MFVSSGSKTDSKTQQNADNDKRLVDIRIIECAEFEFGLFYELRLQGSYKGYPCLIPTQYTDTTTNNHNLNAHKALVYPKHIQPTHNSSEELLHPNVIKMAPPVSLIQKLSCGL